MTTVLLLGGTLAGLFLASFLVEALRSAPDPPERLPWAPEIRVRYLELDTGRIRYLETGHGSPLVLLHTLRAQLDMFQKTIPELARHYRVYALDYPGHGWSDIPRVDYSPEIFVRTVSQFLDRLAIEGAVLVGESIGGSIALLLAARRHPRVRGVVAVNPYDYDRGRGLRRSSTLANLVFGSSQIPLLGATVMRLRNSMVNRRIFAGGVRREGALPPALVREMAAVGNRRGHYQALLSLVRHWPAWEAARVEYRTIDLPVLLLYGEHDWSRDEERAANLRDIPNSRIHILSDAGHFLALDAPEEFVREVTDFVSGVERQPPIEQQRSVLPSGQTEKKGVSP